MGGEAQTKKSFKQHHKVLHIHMNAQQRIVDLVGSTNQGQSASLYNGKVKLKRLISEWFLALGRSHGRLRATLSMRTFKTRERT